MATTVSVTPSVLRWIFNIGSGASNFNMSDTLQSYKKENGVSELPVNLVKDLSHHLHVPLGYFYLDQPIDDTPEIFAQRTSTNGTNHKQPSRELVDVIYDMQDLQDWARQDQISQDGESLDYVGSENSDVSEAKLIRKLLTVLNIEHNWYEQDFLNEPSAAFAFLRERAQRAGMIVMMSGIVGENTKRKLDAREFRAFTLIDKYAPLIFINRSDEPEAARVFSLVHEFVHVLLGESELYTANENSIEHSHLESLCNNVASEIIMPDSEFTHAWHEQSGNIQEKINAVQKAFPISYTAVALRALSHGWISEEQYNQICKKAAEKVAQKAKPSGGDYYKTKRSRFDNRLLAHIAASVAEGRTSYVEAYRLTKTNEKTFARLVEGI